MLFMVLFLDVETHAKCGIAWAFQANIIIFHGIVFVKGCKEHGIITLVFTVYKRDISCFTDKKLLLPDSQIHLCCCLRTVDGWIDGRKIDGWMDGFVMCMQSRYHNIYIF